MELRYLRSFVAVADTLHFGRAGEALRLAQPAVSQHVRKLETDVGAELFTRDRHGVALTAAGRVLFKEAKTILAQVSHARDEVERAKAGGAGGVRLGYLPGPGRDLLVRALRNLRALHPEIRVESRELPSPRVLSTLRAGELDVALLPETAPPHPRGLERAEVGRQRLVIAMGEAHAHARKRVVSLAALSQEKWVIYSEKTSPGYRNWVVEVCAAAGFSPRIGERVTTSSDMMVALTSGAGVALVTEGYRNLFGRAVVCRRLSPEPEPMALWVWWRRGERSPAVAACLEAVRKAAAR
jgi:DNA-binding transcriptional LysR family regulator